MRISTTAFYSRGIDSIQSNTKAVQDTQQRIATGKQVLSASDDPVATTKILRLEDELTLNDQFLKNIDFVENRGELSDGVVGSIDLVLQRVKELTIQANNAAMGPVERNAIALEVRQKQEELLGLVNTQDASGEYLFSGFQGGTEPFSKQSNGSFLYQGDAGQREVSIAPAVNMAVSDSGKKLFVDIPSSATSIRTIPASSNSSEPEGVISIGLVKDQLRLEQAFPEDFIIQFQPLSESTPAGSVNFSVFQRSDGRPVFGDSPAGELNNVTFNQGMNLEFNGVQVTLSGQPQPGDVFTVETTSNVDVLTMIERLATSLEDGLQSDRLVPTQTSVLGLATPPRPTVLQAGNYIAEQTITVNGDDGSVRYATINANDDSGTIAIALDAMDGVSAQAAATSAVLDFSSTASVAGDTIEFTLNGTPIQALAGATDADTYTAIETALNIAFPAPGSPVQITNNGNGQFTIGESNSANITVEDFLVNDVSGVAPAATVIVSGSEGTPVTLLEGSNDSTGIAAILSIQTEDGYDIQSSVPSQSGGIIAASFDENDTIAVFLLSIETALKDLDLAQINILEARTEIGARLNVADATRERVESSNLATITFLSQIRDVDFAEAAANLSLQTFMLEAAQNSFVRISGLSLFNFL